MSQEWYVRQGGAIHGPLSLQVLAQQAQVGQITPETELCMADGGAWIKAANVQGLAFKPSNAAPTTSSSIGEGVYPEPPPLRTSPNAQVSPSPADAVADRDLPLSAGNILADGPSLSRSEGPRTWFLQGSMSETLGPYSRQQLEQWHREGRVKSDSLIFCEGWSSWRKASELFESPAPISKPLSRSWSRELKPIFTGIVVVTIFLLAARRHNAGWGHDNAGNVIEKPGFVNQALRWFSEKPLPKRN